MEDDNANRLHVTLIQRTVLGLRVPHLQTDTRMVRTTDNAAALSAAEAISKTQ